MDSNSALLSAYAEVGPDAEPGAFARAIRLNLQLSLKEVAERLGDGTHFTTVAKLEKGKMVLTYDWARSLASVYGISANVLHMPYEALNQAKRIPVFTAIHDIANRAHAITDSYTSFNTASESLFGYPVLGTPDMVSICPLYTAIVDPNRTTLKMRNVYLFQLVDSEEGIVGIFRDELGFQSILPWPRSGDPIILSDDARPIVHGQVLELQRTLASRNG